MTHTQLEVKQIETAIIKGAKFLLQSINPDNGIKFEDEGSTRSGVWVTAEVLEFFLTTRTLSIASYSQVQPMIEYLLGQQRPDGSWAILSQIKGKKDESSTISTGHCTYILKLAIFDDFLTKDLKSRILNSIKLGENWLRSCCIDRTSYAFWGTKAIKPCDPNIDERSRIEFIFDTFYALMGLSNPRNYPENSQADESIIRKTENFFKIQAEWFINHYRNVLSKNEKIDLSYVLSTFCRIINVEDLFGHEIYDKTKKEEIKQIILKCDNPFTTTKVVVDTSIIKEQGQTYTNNSPFDMGMALINLMDNVEILRNIIQVYLEKQNSVNGYWYLNFSSAYKIKTWTTAEALLVLEKALHTYKTLELKEKEKINSALFEGKVLEIELQRNSLKMIEDTLFKENKRLRIILYSSVVLSLLLAFGVSAGIAYYISLPENKENPITGLFNYIFFPALFLGIGQILTFIADLLNRKKKNNNL